MVPLTFQVTVLPCTACYASHYQEYNKVVLITLNCGYGTHLSDRLQRRASSENTSNGRCNWCGDEQDPQCFMRELNCLDAPALSFSDSPLVLFSSRQMDKILATFLIHYAYFGSKEGSASGSGGVQLIRHRIRECCGCNTP